MSRSKSCTWAVALALVVFGLSGARAETATPSAPKAPGLGDPGKLVSISMDAGSRLMRGADARVQLLVAGKYSSGQTRDLTAQVQYEVSPAGILRVDDSGFATPSGDGKATIKAKGPDGVSDEVYAQVSSEFSGKELAYLTSAIASINVWNRFGAAYRWTPPARKPAVGAAAS